MHKRIGLFFILCALAAACPSRAQSQLPRVEIDQEMMRYAVVSDPAMIRLFVEDFMITEERVEKLRIYDIFGDGYGEGDLARTYPGGKIYLITPGKKVQALMNGWRFGDNIRFTANADDSPETFENAPDSVRALGAIFASLLRGLRRNYKGMPIKISMEQNQGVTSIEMWDYDKRLLQYAPPPVTNREVVKPVYNVIYLEKTISDSVYLSPPAMNRMR